MNSNNNNNNIKIVTFESGADNGRLADQRKRIIEGGGGLATYESLVNNISSVNISESEADIILKMFKRVRLPNLKRNKNQFKTNPSKKPLLGNYAQSLKSRLLVLKIEPKIDGEVQLENNLIIVLEKFGINTKNNNEHNLSRNVLMDILLL